jgi:hypothetical protein
MCWGARCGPAQTLLLHGLGASVPVVYILVHLGASVPVVYFWLSRGLPAAVPLPCYLAVKCGCAHCQVLPLVLLAAGQCAGPAAAA